MRLNRRPTQGRILPCPAFFLQPHNSRAAWERQATVTRASTARNGNATGDGGQTGQRGKTSTSRNRCHLELVDPELRGHERVIATRLLLDREARPSLGGRLPRGLLHRLLRDEMSKSRLTPQGATLHWRRARKNVGESKGARLSLLKHFAALVITRDVDGTRAERRERHERGSTKPQEWKEGVCWACRLWRVLVRHHVIQLQHGGTNWNLNIETICDECHAEVHPWLKGRWRQPRQPRKLGHAPMQPWQLRELAKERRRRNNLDRIDRSVAQARATFDPTPRLVKRGTDGR